MRSCLILADAAPPAFPACGGASAIVLKAPAPGRLPRGARAAEGWPPFYLEVGPITHPDVDRFLETWRESPPDGIFLKGAENGAHVQHLGAKLAVFEARAGLPDGALGVIAAAAGTPAATFDLASFAGCSQRLRALAFDRDALAGSLGVARAAAPLGLARGLLVLAAAAAGLPALDAPCRDAADLALLRKECLAARRDGFKGKLGTTPAEIAVIEEIFAASLQECVAKLPHSAP